MREEQLDEKRYKPATLARRISDAKNRMISPSDYEADSQIRAYDRATQLGEAHRIYSLYDKRLKESDAMDFDDLLLNTFRLFRQSPETLERYRDLFKYVLVDEYQDTNVVQHRIVVQLTKERQRVCVVGDDSQSIYSFRGAVVGNIISFRDLYPGTRVFKLERNYRSTQTIVYAANCLIANNNNRIPKEVYSKRDKGEPIKVCEAYSDKEEASIVANKIVEIRRRLGVPLSHFAVLYRTNSQSRPFEEEFHRFGISYRVVAGTSFYERREIRDALAYFRLAVNLHDEVSLRRIINVPARGIGDTTMRKLSEAATAAGLPLWDAVMDAQAIAPSLSSATCRRLSDFAQMMMAAHELREEKDAHSLALQLMRDSGMWAQLSLASDREDVDRRDNVQQLLDGVASFVAEAEVAGYPFTMEQYLQNISLLSDLDTVDYRSGDFVTLMTMHSAKGLEFGTVFVVGLEEGLFPSAMSLEQANVEEERRLFYVAMTRAQERLFLTWSHSRMRQGRYESNPRSRFIAEIASDLPTGRERERQPYGHEMQARPAGRAPVPVRPQGIGGASPQPGYGLKVGDRVRHARFGEGVVRSIGGEGLDAKAEVDFGAEGVKRLLLRFAKLERLGGEP